MALLRSTGRPIAAVLASFWLDCIGFSAMGRPWDSAIFHKPGIDDGRQRDVFPLPLLHVEEPHAGNVCRAVQQRIHLKYQIARRVNKAIRSLNLLFHGGDNFNMPEPVTDLKSLPLIQRDAILGILEKVKDLGPPNTACRLEALKVLRATEASGYDVPDGTSGSTVPMKLDLLSLPSRGGQGVDLVGSLSEPIRNMVVDFENYMLRDAGEWSELTDTVGAMKAYNDPMLSCRSSYLDFLKKLYGCGVLNFAAGCKGRVGAFCVAKKPKLIDGVTVVKQRLVLDCRQTNLLFRPPPHTRLGSLAAISESELVDGATLKVAGADIRDCFYAVNLELQQYFALASDLSDAEVTAVTGGAVEAGSGRGVPVISVLPMGFSWSFYLVQQLHTDIALRALGLDERHLFLDGQPAPSLENDNLTIMPDCDNIHSISTDSSRCQDAKDGMVSALEEIGFELHEHVEATSVFETLGGVIEGEKGVVRSSLKRMWLLIHAFEIAAVSVMSTKTIQRLLGHSMVVCVLNRCGMSIFRKLYDFAASNSEPRLLYPSERSECLIFAGLVPLLVTDLRRPWADVITCTDASPFGFGICERDVQPALARQHGKWLERWRFKRLPPSEWKPRQRSQGWDVLGDHRTVVGNLVNEDELGDEFIPNPVFPEIPDQLLQPDLWRTVKMGKWEHTGEHITLKEGRSLLLAVRRLSRCSRHRRKRHLFLVDNISLCFSVAKGRSHSFDMHRVLQKVSAISLACSMTIRTRWIRSEVNAADGPSRGFVKPGAAPSGGSAEVFEEFDCQEHSANWEHSEWPSAASPDPCAQTRDPSQGRPEAETPAQKSLGGRSREGEEAASTVSSGLSRSGGGGEKSKAEHDDDPRDEKCQQREPFAVLHLLPQVRGLLEGERNPLASSQRRGRPSCRRLYGHSLPRWKVSGRGREEFGGVGVLQDRPQELHAPQSSGAKRVEKMHACPKPATTAKGPDVRNLHEIDGQGLVRHGASRDHNLRPIPSSWGSFGSYRQKRCCARRRSWRPVQVGDSCDSRFRRRSARQGGRVRQLAADRQREDQVDRESFGEESQKPEQCGLADVHLLSGAVQEGVRGSRKGPGCRTITPIPASSRGCVRRLEQWPSGPQCCEVKGPMENRPKRPPLCQNRTCSTASHKAHSAQSPVLPLVGAQLGEGVCRSGASSFPLSRVPPSPEFSDVFTIKHRPRQFALEIFAGTARLSSALEKAGERCFPIDICLFPSHNVLSQDVERSIVHFIQQDRIKFIWFGMPCTTFSRARRSDGIGPGPLRTNEHIWGLPGLTPSDQYKLRQGNRMFLFTLRLMKLCDKQRVPFVVENPFSSMAWDVPAMRRFIHDAGCLECNLDFCMYGEKWKKPTKLIYKFLRLDSLENRCASSNHICSRTGRPHVPLTGLDKTGNTGKFMAMLAQPYPWSLADALSAEIATTLRG